MADYKRMISYMYQYENGVKRKNVGYARIEARNGQIKLTLHMQLLGQLDSIFPTYLIQRDKNGVNLIYLGDAVLKNQTMDSKLTAEENNIMDTGNKLSDMGGLLLFMHDNIFIASEWDDKPIVANELLDALKPKKQESKEAEAREQDDRKEEGLLIDLQENQQEDLQSDLHEDLQGDLQESPEGEQQEELTAAGITTAATESAKPEPLSPEGLSLAEEISMPKYKLPRGWKTVERLQRPTAAEINNSVEHFIWDPSLLEVKPEQPAERAAEEKQLAAEFAGEKQFPEEPGEESQHAEEFTGEKQFAEEPSEERQLAEESAGEKQFAEELGEGEQLLAASVAKGSQQVEETEAEEKSEHPVAKHLFDVYPRIYPFEDNEILLCVKIEPKDIGMLPKDLWALSNNSFLMHGFYCYHHLIFAKLKDRYGCRYILGIPGIYHTRERFMARMFGFESFKSIRRRELQQGDFGYWYLDVNF